MYNVQYRILEDGKFSPWFNRYTTNSWGEALDFAENFPGEVRVTDSEQNMILWERL